MSKQPVGHVPADQYNAENIVRHPRRLDTIGGKETLLVLFVRHGDQVNAEWVSGSEAYRWASSLQMCGASVSAFNAADDITGDVWVEVRIDL